MNLPVYVVTTAGAETAFGPAKIMFCLAPPDIPADKGGAPRSERSFSAPSSRSSGVFSTVASGAWSRSGRPGRPRVGQPNAAGSVASPSGIAPGSLSVKVAKAGLLKSKVTGKVAQGGAGVGGAKIEVWAGKSRTGLKRVATTSTKADGSYAFTYGKAAAFFRTRTVVAAHPVPALCTQLQGSLPVPCVNAGFNGFTALSAISKR